MSTLGIPASDIVRVLMEGAMALSSSSIDVEELQEITSAFVKSVYVEQIQSRQQALTKVPDTESGRAFIAAERLVQPTGFA
jgi:flagellar biosynthesis/type III secretory pathway chaperone